MDQDMEQQVYLKQYMLGDLDEEKRRQIEERLLTDGDYFSELLVVEDELVDDYVTNSLSAHEHEWFEDQYLSTPKRVQKVKFARAFRRYILNSLGAAESTEGPPPQPLLPLLSRRLTPIMCALRSGSRISRSRSTRLSAFLSPRRSFWQRSSDLNAGLLRRGGNRLKLSGSNASDDGFEEIGTHSFRVPNN